MSREHSRQPLASEEKAEVYSVHRIDQADRADEGWLGSPEKLRGDSTGKSNVCHERLSKQMGGMKIKKNLMWVMA